MGALVASLVLASATSGWGVAEVGGAPALVRDGQPVAPCFFWQAVPSEMEFKALSGKGLHLYSLFSSATHYGHPYWKSREEIDVSYMVGEMDRVLAMDPDACLLPRIYAIAPGWWVRENPDECFVCGCEEGRINHESFASAKARREVGEAFGKVVKTLYERYGDRLVGIHVCCGPWGEWFTWDAEPACGKYHGENPTAGDMSEPMRRAFSAWLKRKYGGGARDDKVSVPTREERRRLDVGIWRDPARSRRVMDYFQCHHEVTASMIRHYCRIVKEVSGGKLLTSVFYGYLPEETWGLECDHRAPDVAYGCRYIDAFSSPHTYCRRTPGADGGYRQCFSSAALHGKLFIDEADDRTHLEFLKKGFRDGAFSHDMNDSLGVLWREFGNAVTRGCGLWYMDVRTGNFKDPAILDVVAKARRIHEAAMGMPRSHESEVAVVSNPRSEFYYGYRNTVSNNIAHASYVSQMNQFYRAGAPFDWYLIDDIEHVAKGRAKVVVFLDCSMMSDRERSVVEGMRSGGRTLVWTHAPAYVSERDLSVMRMEKLTGFGFDRVGSGTLQSRVAETGRVFGRDLLQLDLFLPQTRLGDEVLGFGVGGEMDGRACIVKREMRGWRSVFASVPAVTTGMLRKIYREAGVHIYVDKDVVVSANDGWLMLHAAESDTFKVSLPKKAKSVLEVVSDRMVGKGISEFDWKMNRHSTAIFRLCQSVAP